MVGVFVSWKYANPINQSPSFLFVTFTSMLLVATILTILILALRSES